MINTQHFVENTLKKEIQANNLINETEIEKLTLNFHYFYLVGLCMLKVYGFTYYCFFFKNAKKNVVFSVKKIPNIELDFQVKNVKSFPFPSYHKDNEYFYCEDNVKLNFTFDEKSKTLSCQLFEITLDKNITFKKEPNLKEVSVY